MKFRLNYQIFQIIFLDVSTPQGNFLFLLNTPISAEYPDGIGCSLKVTINAKWWLPTQSWLERFTLKPSTPSAAVLNGIERVGETTLDVYDRIRKLF